MKAKSAFILTAAALSLAACSGGGGSSSTPVMNNPNPGSGANMPSFDTVTTHAGAQAVAVDPSSHRTLYYVDGDTPPGTACNASASCTTIWPEMTPGSGSQASGNFTIVTRTDSGQQWAYKGHALYHYSGDSGADQDNGEYGPWHPAAQ